MVPCRWRDGLESRALDTSSIMLERNSLFAYTERADWQNSSPVGELPAVKYKRFAVPSPVFMIGLAVVHIMICHACSEPTPH